VELKITERQGVEIDYCPKCRGVWLDRGELDKLIERAALMESQPAASAPRREDRDAYYRDDDDYPYKRKNDERYRDDYQPHPQGKKKKSFLGEMFDIFD
jgi:Zn-finger nucleic acid-binding protein